METGLSFCTVAPVTHTACNVQRYIVAHVYPWLCFVHGLLCARLCFVHGFVLLAMQSLCTALTP